MRGLEGIAREADDEGGDGASDGLAFDFYFGGRFFLGTATFQVVG
jgi:hypothetical protein